jgi:flagellar basal-body rod protein FlgB
MINRLISNEMMDLVHKSLDAAALQHKAISNNLANVDTPGFKRSEVVFRDKLKKAIDAKKAASQDLDLARTDARHIGLHASDGLSEINPEVILQNQTSLRNDQNNVDIDLEMAKLAQNTVVYQALAQITQSQFAELKNAIREGK